MLQDKAAMATVAVKDIQAARKFYEGTLGLQKLDGPEPSVAAYQTGASTLLVYESQYAGTNKGTAVTWTIASGLADLVRDLKAKGVAFEHYDFPGTTLEGDVHVAGGIRVAWFKDPDGNIHSLVNR